MTLIRRAQRSDWRAIRNICSQTGNAGDPIELKRKSFFEDYWIGVYERFFPHHAYVVESQLDNHSRIQGYLLSSPDELWFRWVLGLYKWVLLIKICSGVYPFSADLKLFLKKFFGLRNEIRDLLSQESWDQVFSFYPAHLHMNLLPEARSLSLGSELIDIFKEDCRRQRITGIHLLCGENVRKFYEKHGFRVLEFNKAYLMVFDSDQLL